MKRRGFHQAYFCCFLTITLRLRFVSERADSSETLMSVSIPERPGAIREFYKVIIIIDYYTLFFAYVPCIQVFMLCSILLRTIIVLILKYVS